MGCLDIKTKFPSGKDNLRISQSCYISANGELDIAFLARDLKIWHEGNGREKSEILTLPASGEIDKMFGLFDQTRTLRRQSGL